ncbi:uromodulin-like isoform X2 [Hyperolius riggenbachi]|uniref:uromodulin-like isoform X2 n=1 Tax=Hyperolius riggenbachi TaxID=752182 RepID=UPI0035A35B4A
MLLLCALFLFTTLTPGGVAGSQCYSGTDHPVCADCRGLCTPENGCLCSDFETHCLPTTDCLTVPVQVCCPLYLYWDPDNTCCSTTYDLSPTVLCLPEIIFFSLNKCLLQSLGYDPASYRLNNDSVECVNTYVDTDENGHIESIELEAVDGWCGNEVISSSIFLSYTNWVHISPYPQNRSTSNNLTFPVTCSYIDGSASITGFGFIDTKAQMFSDAGFQNEISSGAPVSLGTYIYFQLTLISPIFDGYVLRAENCYATPLDNKNSSLRVNLVVGGCPANEEVDTVVLQNGVSTEMKMKLASFKFTDYPLVFIFCDVTLCIKSDICAQCNTGRALDNLQTFQVGFFSVTEDNNLSSSGSLTVVSWSLLTACVLLFISMV